MKTKKEDNITSTLLYYNNVSYNVYEKGIDITSNFLLHASKKYKTKLKRKDGISKIYYDNKLIGEMKGLLPSTTSTVAFNLCKDKFKLEKYLSKLGISTLNSQLYYEDQKSEAFNYIKENQEYTYVLKPLNLAGGTGIELDVSIENFSDSWDKSIEVQKSHKRKRPSCILQPFIKGFDVRICIVEGRFNSALLRLPAHVIGDGKNDIKFLIEEKNKTRQIIPYFRSKLIKIDKNLNEFLAKKDLTIDSVIEKGTPLLLSNISNLTLGGESIDITNTLSPSIKNLAMNATASIPGLYTSGVDIMTPDFKNGDGYVIEVNTNANHTMHHIPLKGRKRKPYFTFINSLLIKYKINNAIRLSSMEARILKDMNNFNQKKNEYFSLYYKNK